MFSSSKPVVRKAILVPEAHELVMRNTLLITASEDRILFENGIVAVLGDESDCLARRD